MAQRFTNSPHGPPLAALWITLIGMGLAAYAMADTPIAPVIWMSVGAIATLLWMDNAAKNLHRSVQDLIDHVQNEHDRETTNH